MIESAFSRAGLWWFLAMLVFYCVLFGLVLTST